VTTSETRTRARYYEAGVIEAKWQKAWEEAKLYKTPDFSDRPKWYAVTMYPYPSGDLHIGHWYAMVPSDAVARFKRMNGYNVLFPMGFDAFGLPAENAAISRNIHPHIWTMDNIENMRRQMRSMGAMFDWDREIITCLPDYYKWNQWLFLQFLKNGLVYRGKAPVWWCPRCQTVLANEQVVDGTCERCHSEVSRRDLTQWFGRITNYAEELLDFSTIDWPERVVTMQRNWIGRSEGARVVFQSEQEDPIEVFTTRPDTLWGATFMVFAPEHPLVEKLTTDKQRAEVDAYVAQARRQTEIQRMSTENEKTGVFTGAYAVNPVNDERVPIWIADYVLMGYGTGAIMAVPAHDQRDFEFAKKFDLPIRVVIKPEGSDLDSDTITEAYAGEGVMVNSAHFDGTPTAGGEAVTKVIEWLEEQGRGSSEINYRFRDWLISRQRYWGTPIPIVYCDSCGIVPVPEADLPVLLPEDSEFEPTGVSPLKTDEGFVNTTCPKCGGPAQRETDTLDTFVDSSWYQYRFLNPNYEDGPVDPDLAAQWLPVDQYTGGIEHATMHLLYTRFFTKAMRDIGLINIDEPFTRLYNQGIILGEDNEKMSKSRGNVVDPDELVDEQGADVVRLYLMFIAPWEQGGPWNSRGIAGIERFVRRVWSITDETADIPAADGVDSDIEKALKKSLHKTIQVVTDDLGSFEFNTMLARMMEFVNDLYQLRERGATASPVWRESLESLALMLAPSAPHLAEELWQRLGREFSVHEQSWPSYDPALTVDDTVEFAVQINGKVRDRIETSVDASEESVVALAMASPRVEDAVGEKQVRKVIYVPGRILNIVVG
jgi:leucyl-tRNA synthetase